MNRLPIRKVAVAGVAFATSYVLRAIGVDLGPELVNEAALGVVTLAAAYITRDPRVQAAEAAVVKVATDHPQLVADAQDVARRVLEHNSAVSTAVKALDKAVQAAG